jgi:hypothetical protein
MDAAVVDVKSSLSQSRVVGKEMKENKLTSAGAEG